MWGNLNKIFVLAFLSLSVLAMVVVGGCINKPVEGIQVNYSVNISVVDASGNSIQNQTNIYEIEGVLSNTSQTGYSKGYGAGVTVNGSSHCDGSTWPVASGNYMVFGASTDNKLLNDDFDKRKFNPGNAGYWTILTYDDITKNTTGRQNVTLHVDLLVSNETGKMMGTPKDMTYRVGPSQASPSSSRP